MSISKSLIAASLACALVVGSACSPKDEDEAKKTAQKIEDQTKEIAGKTVEKTKEVAGEIADKSKQAVSATGEVITDGWVTAKVSAKFSDEKLLKDSKINVDTKDRIVTLKGTVTSDEARKRAEVIANGTEGVAGVVDELVVKAK